MYLSSKLWFLAAVKETETSEELFFLGWTYFFPWPPYGLGKKSSSMVSFFYRPKNSVETEYIFCALLETQ